MPVVDTEAFVKTSDGWKSFRTGRGLPQSASQGYDWSDTNLPWAYTSTDQFTADWPEGVQIVDIPTTSSDFYTNLAQVNSSTSGRYVVRLGEGVYELDAFRMIGTSGDPTYAFGFWFPRLQGLLGQGPDKTFVEMAADSMTQAQLDHMKAMRAFTFIPLQIGLCRIDSTTNSPVLLAGITFRAHDQQDLTEVHPELVGLGVVVPQPAPHNGVFLYSDAVPRESIVSYCRFQAAGRAMLSGPPFECGNLSSVGRGYHKWHHLEFDGRRSPAVDSAQPRRCAPFLINSEYRHELVDSWFHHSNLSRYAANDENHPLAGEYIVTRCKAEQITNNKNADPALNGGVSLGGVENATPFGWESTNGTITVTDCIVSQDNNSSSGGVVPMHYQLTSVGSRNPQGGRMYVHGGEHRNTGWPWLDEFVCFRIATMTFWWSDGVINTIFVYHPDGQRLSAYVAPSPWPPSAASLQAAGVTPSTHYIIRQN
jgi:hypothetical protein